MERIDLFEAMCNKFSELKRDGKKSDFSCGELDALRNYIASKRHNSSEFEVTELPGAWNTGDFIKVLRAANLKSFIVTAKDTWVIDILHRMSELGCTVCGLDAVVRNDTEYGVMGVYQVNGIRIKL